MFKNSVTDTKRQIHARRDTRGLTGECSHELASDQHGSFCKSIFTRWDASESHGQMYACESGFNQCCISSGLAPD